ETAGPGKLGGVGTPGSGAPWLTPGSSISPSKHAVTQQHAASTNHIRHVAVAPETSRPRRAIICDTPPLGMASDAPTQGALLPRGRSLSTAVSFGRARVAIYAPVAPTIVARTRNAASVETDVPSRLGRPSVVGRTGLIGRGRSGLRRHGRYANCATCVALGARPVVGVRSGWVIRTVGRSQRARL